MRSFVELVVSSIKGLWARPARTALILLGPVIGVSAIVAAIGLSESAKGDVKARLDELGTNLATVQAASGFAPGGGLPRLPEEAGERISAIPVIESV